MRRRRTLGPMAEVTAAGDAIPTTCAVIEVHLAEYAAGSPTGARADADAERSRPDGPASAGTTAPEASTL